jgi:hypothetical protein
MPATATKHPLAFIALGTAIIALIVHLLAAFSHASPSIGVVLLVTLPGLLCFGAFIFAVNRRGREADGKRASLVELMAPLPTWAKVLNYVVFLYAMLNFMLFMRATGGGSLKQQPNGQYVLSDHGRVIRTLDEAGVQVVHAQEVRLISGHLLPFLVLPGLYFLFVPSRREVIAGIPPAP